MNRIVLITGCSSGFGKACAEKFASDGDNLIITGRRKERLEALKEKLEAQYNVKVQVLVFDVQNNQQVTEAILSLDNSWQHIDILVNNAGLALGRHYFEEASISDWETMIDTNLKGVIYVTKAVLPVMVKRRKGHILNIGSVAGKEVYEKGNGYCASKFAVDALTKSMRTDLLRHRIKVTGIHPGAAETEFSNVRFKGDDALAAQIYEGYKPLTPEDVADAVFYCCSLPDHVCINDLVMTCTSQANAYYFFRE
jgi:3-hydroxy acid dehydrogenase / malonic semialdehyde reductase